MYSKTVRTPGRDRRALLRLGFVCFNQNESLTLVSQSPVVSHHWSSLVTTPAYWTTIKSMVVQYAGVGMMIKSSP
ncbi:hypothetical protein PR003_g26417 [Phytophthora rubi]|uniref:Uncharacterized protein n=1 Tax=Phytophthora rubi TaxID=129364 RepID=A0A6A4C8X8_9STRA|nr:hypothetical protein PR002_g25119 [Phytophthora rubi]KAE9286059.1 hypothetical protein PR003_g26417 [Phytophthora rubi]